MDNSLHHLRASRRDQRHIKAQTAEPEKQKLAGGRGSILGVDIDASGCADTLHCPIKLLRVQIFQGFFHTFLLKRKPGVQIKALVFHQRPRQFSGGPLICLLPDHRIFHILKIPVADMAGKPGNGGLRHLQPLCQLPDAHKEKFLGAVFDKFSDFQIGFCISDLRVFHCQYHAVSSHMNLL